MPSPPFSSFLGTQLPNLGRAANWWLGHSHHSCLILLEALPLLLCDLLCFGQHNYILSVIPVCCHKWHAVRLHVLMSMSH